MPKLILFFVMGLLIFGAAAGGSAYLLQQRIQNAEAEKKNEPLVPSLAASGADTETVPTDPTDENTPDAAQMPIAVRSRPMSAEEIYRYGVAFRKRQDSLNAREKSIEQQESRIKLLMEDLRGEQKELESLQEQIKKKATDAQSLLQTAIEKENAVAQERQAAATQALAKEQQTAVAAATPAKPELPTLTPSEQDNIKKLATWFQKIEPETSAEYIKELMNDGNINTAVQILSHFEEREASKILAAMGDPKIVVQLAEEFKKLKKPEPRVATQKR